MSTTGEAIQVLHVDDDPDFADIAATFLEREGDGFVVETATSAAAALDRLADLDVDCIVSDYDMPEMDGLEFLAAVRDDHPDLPFVLFTGKGSEEIASQAISAGVTDYIQKEVGTGQYAVLANRIRNAVAQYRSQRELEASQQRLSLFVEQSPLGVLEYNSDFEIVGLNEAGEEILGYSEAELRGETWTKLVTETSYENVDEVTSALAEAEGGYHSIDENVRKDGERIVCEWHNRVVTDDCDDVVAVFSQFQDVTERQERRRRIEALHEATRELMAASSQEAVADRAVETARNVLGLPINSVYLYDGAADALVPAATTEEALDLIGEPPVYEPGESLSWEAFTSGEVQVFEDVSAEPGRYNPETAFGAEIILPLGDYGVMYVAATEPGAFDDADVTLARTLAANAEQALSRIEREETLRESQRRYRTLVENFPDGAVFLFDDDLQYVLAGGAELSSVGLSATDFEDVGPRDLFPADIAEETIHYYHEALEGRSNTFEQEYQGEQYRIQTIPVRDDAGDIVSGIAVSQNITERKLRERELARQNERLEEFASVVSHDLRNPLNVAEGHLDLLQQECDRGRLDAVSRAHDRMNALIDDLLTLAREGEEVGDLEAVDLAAITERCWRNVDTDGATIDLRTDRTIRADPSRLQQLLENLVRNSVEHGSTGNRTKSGDSVEHGTTDDGVTVTVGDLPDGFYVADDGPGIPEAERDRIFDAGYTTSQDGTGFGLRIVEQVAEAHAWDIEVLERDGGGARFEITGVEFDA
ncbi:hybrid sensor histidine kinase/response regulator [Haloplanus natans]|uniref:hybrid sensor histidine kinase/response regulator n=1 Tax=Haloplanus natans TaxID=376171 RepID=UPI000677B76C|nr:PAS domain S-box protein [Haloplanus natans]